MEHNLEDNLVECSGHSESIQFISGWISETLETGEQPSYGYPKNHLPEITKGFEMEVKTGFTAHMPS